jgi:hypothetical protein
MIKSWGIRWAGHVACLHGREMKNAYKILVGKSKGSNQLEDLSVNEKNGIRMNLREIGWEGVDWMHLAIKGGKFSEYLSDY